MGIAREGSGGGWWVGCATAGAPLLLPRTRVAIRNAGSGVRRSIRSDWRGVYAPVSEGRGVHLITIFAIRNSQ